jgi:hypothetical protein
MDLEEKVKILFDTLNILSDKNLNKNEEEIYCLYLEELSANTTFLHRYFIDDLVNENIISEKIMSSIINLREKIIELLEDDLYRDINSIVNSEDWIKIRKNAFNISQSLKHKMNSDISDMFNS